MILRVGGEMDTVTVHTDRKIKRKKGNCTVQIVTEPEDNTYRESFLRGDDYATTRPSPSGIKGECESERVSFIHVRPPEIQATFYMHRGRSHGQRQDQILYKTTKEPRHPVYRVAIRGRCHMVLQ